MADQKINVVVSGSTNTQVVGAGTNTINVNQSPSTVNVSQSSSSSSVATAPQTNVNVGFLGVQGIAGTATTSPNGSVNGEVLYNRNGYISGARSFFYYPDANQLKVSGNSLLLSHGSSLVLSGSATDENAFLIRDSSNKNLLKVDTSNKRIILAEDVGATEYKLGVGTGEPTERVHISNGNLRLDGNMLLSGNILPLKSGVFSLGSPEFPFKDLYLQGNSIVFVDQDAKITASSTGFSFQVTGSDGAYQNLFEANSANVGVFAGDGTALTGLKYSGLQDAGAFVQQSVPSGSASVTVNYGKTLNYDPIVLCSLSSSNSNNNLYFTTVEDVTRSSCKAFFSEKVSGDGFVLNCNISPINPVF